MTFLVEIRKKKKKEIVIFQMILFFEKSVVPAAYMIFVCVCLIGEVLNFFSQVGIRIIFVLQFDI